MRTHIDARIHAEINRLLLFLFPAMLTGLGLAALVGRVADQHTPEVDRTKLELPIEPPARQPGDAM
jgi:hypothetical protein